MNAIRQLMAGVLATVVALAIPALSERGQTSTPAPIAVPCVGGAFQIAFSGLRNNQRDIYVANVDGSNEVNLTNDFEGDYDPVWSPDGRKIAFYSDRTVYWDVWVMDADGSDRTRLTYNGGWSPSWSPDSTQIAFVSDRADTEDIYVMNADGSGQRRLTYDRYGDVVWKDWGIAWSPDGKRIAFACYRDGDWEIYTINTSGTDLHKLTNNSDHDGFPAWSPDGKKIAFMSTRNQRYEIFVMNADGSGQTPVALGSAPAWSPDGTKIAFHSSPFAYYAGDIYIGNADGSGQPALITHSGNDRNPSWRPPYKASLPLIKCEGIGLTP